MSSYLFKFGLLPPQPAGLRNCNAAAFASFKKYATHFLNTDCVGTEPKEAAYAVTVLKSNSETSISFCKLFEYFKLPFQLYKSHQRIKNHLNLHRLNSTTSILVVGYYYYTPPGQKLNLPAD